MIKWEDAFLIYVKKPSSILFIEIINIY
jgi:hypothetical protein